MEKLDGVATAAFVKSVPKNSDDKEVPLQAVKGTTIKARLQSDVTIPRLRKRKCRLILRNLSFQATVANVAARMLRYAVVKRLALPLHLILNPNPNPNPFPNPDPNPDPNPNPNPNPRQVRAPVGSYVTHGGGT